MRLGGARPGAGTTVGEGGLGPGKGPDNDKNTGFVDSEGNPITYGEDKTQVGFSKTYYDNNPEAIKATLEDTSVSNTNALKSLYNNFIKDIGEDAFIDRYSNYTDNPEVARLASIKANVSPGDFFGGLMSLAQNPLGTGYNIASTGTLTGFNPAALANLGITGTVASLLGQMATNQPAYAMNPSNYAFTGPMSMDAQGNLVQDFSYTGPMSSNPAVNQQIADIQSISGVTGLTLDQQADIAISQFEKEQAEKNARPGATSPVTQTFINPVESKFTGEQLIAYNRYIERGYTPEIAEYLVTRT